MTELIRIEKGSPDPDEPAALTVVLLARAAARAEADERRPAGRTPVRRGRRERRAAHRTSHGRRGGGAAR